MPSDACAAMWMKDLEEIKESNLRELYMKMGCREIDIDSPAACFVVHIL